MSRSGYSDCLDHWDLARWRGSVSRAVNGKRGQAFLKELLAAMDALDDKELIRGEIIDHEGSVCALGAVAVARGIEDDAKKIDPEESEDVATMFGIARSLACEIQYMNDEHWEIFRDEITPAKRFQNMRNWVKGLINDG